MKKIYIIVSCVFFVVGSFIVYNMKPQTKIKEESPKTEIKEENLRTEITYIVQSDSNPIFFISRESIDNGVEAKKTFYVSLRG